MSQENVEIGLRFAASFKAREVPEELLAPDFVMENVSTPVTDRTYVGGEGIREWFSDFFDVMSPDSLRYEAEPTDVGADYVVARISLGGRGRVSGAPLDLTHWGVLWIRDGRVAKAVGFGTRREALEAVGLSE